MYLDQRPNGLKAISGVSPFWSHFAYIHKNRNQIWSHTKIRHGLQETKKDPACLFCYSRHFIAPYPLQFSMCSLLFPEIPLLISTYPNTSFSCLLRPLQLTMIFHPPVAFDCTSHLAINHKQPCDIVCILQLNCFNCSHYQDHGPSFLFWFGLVFTLEAFVNLTCNWHTLY